jgi:hypothetical protein
VNERRKEKYAEAFLLVAKTTQTGAVFAFDVIKSTQHKSAIKLVAVCVCVRACVSVLV